MGKNVVFTAKIDEVKAQRFDEIAARNLRSRAAHIEFLVDQEIEEYREVREVSKQ